MTQKLKKYIVLDKDDVHEYNIHVEETDKGVKTSLFASNNDIWTEHTKGELFLSMIDDGFNVKLDRSIKTMDYGVLFCLRLLLNFENHLDGNTLNQQKSKIIEDKVIVEL